MEPPEKQCISCKLVKPASEFYRHGGRNPELRRPDCKACRRKVIAAAYRQTPAAVRQAATRKRHLKRSYGLTLEDYARLLREQGGVCAICRQPTGQTLHVDHNHACCAGTQTCGECTRGLLCTRCNGALGWLEENFLAAWEYLHVPHSGYRSLRHALQEVGYI